MSIAYIILAHKLPVQVARLVDRLDSPSASFLVHVERNTDDAIYNEIVHRLRVRSNVHFMQRLECAWGHWSLVEATLQGLWHAYLLDPPPSHVILLSGQDYPLVPPHRIEQFFNHGHNLSWTWCRRMPDYTWYPDGGMHRIGNRKPPLGLVPFHGSQWISLSYVATKYVMDFVNNHKEIVDYFRMTEAPDEMFFHTILSNSPLANHIVQSDLHFVNWSTTPAPKTLDVQDLDSLMASGMLFARKFDITQDSSVLDLIDARLGVTPSSSEGFVHSVSPSAHLSTPAESEGALTSIPTPYDAQFYPVIGSRVIDSARVVAPRLIDLIHPRSVVDLCCGTGEWLAAFRELGITDLLAIDGDWVPSEQLQIPQDLFMAHDLCSPLHLERTFDCAVSMETAEHLPAECEATYIASLVRLAPVVLFSIAFPRQSGLEHLDKQGLRYWSDRFGEHNYVTIDCIRPLICTSTEVEPWYLRNVLLFAERSFVDRHEILKVQYALHGGLPMPVVDTDFMSGTSASLVADYKARRAQSELTVLKANIYQEACHQLLRLVSEVRDERDGWKRQAKRHEEALRELRSRLRGHSKKKKSRKE